MPNLPRTPARKKRPVKLAEHLTARTKASADSIDTSLAALLLNGNSPPAKPPEAKPAPAKFDLPPRVMDARSTIERVETAGASQAPPPFQKPQLLSFTEAGRMTSLSRSTIERLVKIGDFPQPVAVTELRRAFVLSEVIAWIEARVAARSGQHDRPAA